MMIYVERVNPDVPLSEDDVRRINEMLQVLSPAAPEVSLQRMMTVARSHTLLVARGERDRIMGMAVLVVVSKMLRTVGLVEEVIRHDDARGQNVGRALMDELHQRAKDLGCAQLELTSHPTRIRANKLYQELGYVRRETNLYRFTF